MVLESRYSEAARKMVKALSPCISCAGGLGNSVSKRDVVLLISLPVKTCARQRGIKSKHPWQVRPLFSPLLEVLCYLAPCCAALVSHLWCQLVAFIELSFFVVLPMLSVSD